MLAELKARLKALTGELDALISKAAPSDEDIGKVETLSTDIEKLEKQIGTVERAEQSRAARATPADTALPETLPATAKKDDLTAAEKVGFLAVAVARAKLDGGGSSPKAVFRSLDEAGYGFLAREFDNAKTRALNAGSAAAGGIFVPEEISDEVIGLLRPQSTFLQGDPRRVQFTNGNYHVPKVATGTAAYWRGEGKPIPPSQPTFQDINMSAKFLGALVPITDQLLRWSRIDIRAWVERDLTEAMGQKVDEGAYFGSGTIYEPLGIGNIPGIGTTPASGGLTPTVAQIETNASALELRMMMTNLPMNRAAWVMSPRSLVFLQNLRDGNGNRYFPELQNSTPIWRNKPVYTTTIVPINGGGTTDESKILLVNFGDAYFGESRALTFAVSNEATYVKNGVTVSAFQNELTLIRATTEVDVALRYLEAVQVLTGVRWGA